MKKQQTCMVHRRGCDDRERGGGCVKSVVSKGDETFSKCFGTKTTIYHELTLACTRTHSLSFFFFFYCLFYYYLLCIYLCFYYMMRVIDLGRKFLLFAFAPTYCLVPRKLETTVERLFRLVVW